VNAFLSLYARLTRVTDQRLMSHGCDKQPSAGGETGRITKFGEGTRILGRLAEIPPNFRKEQKGRVTQTGLNSRKQSEAGEDDERDLEPEIHCQKKKMKTETKLSSSRVYKRWWLAFSTTE
jgi:hypothetical protein